MFEKNRDGKNKVKKNQSVDVVGNVIEDLIVSRRRYAMLTWVLFFLVVISYVPVFYFLFFKKERVILLDCEGRPQLSLTVPDEGVFKTEVQSFYRVVMNQIYEKDYVSFMDEKEVRKFVLSMMKYFRNKDDLNSFMNTFMNSPFVRSVVTNKYMVKVGETSVIDLRKSENNFVAVGRIDLTIYSTGGDNEVIEAGEKKTVVMEFIKGMRTAENPYGLYLVKIYEIGR